MLPFSRLKIGNGIDTPTSITFSRSKERGPPAVVRRGRLSLPYRTNAVALGTAWDFANVMPFSASCSRNIAAFKSGRVARALAKHEASVSEMGADDSRRLNK